MVSKDIQGLNCEKYFNNSTLSNKVSEKDYGNSLWYLPNGNTNIRFNDKLYFYIRVNDPSYNLTNETFTEESFINGTYQNFNLKMIIFDT
ncbi:22457_t:CDS:1, partial [Gigaspora margarita]